MIHNDDVHGCQATGPHRQRASTARATNAAGGSTVARHTVTVGEIRRAAPAKIKECRRA
jgi:hypothetical protein